MLLNVLFVRCLGLYVNGQALELFWIWAQHHLDLLLSGLFVRALDNYTRVVVFFCWRRIRSVCCEDSCLEKDMV